MALLEIENLSVEFPSATGLVRAVDGVSLTVSKGELLGVVGESGSGKSLTMLAVMGLVPYPGRVTADRLTFKDRDLLTLSDRERRQLAGKSIAMIFQEPTTSLNPCFTVGFQLIEGLRVHEKMGREAARRRAIELLEQVGIPAAESRMRAYPHQLSGGMNQRVMIAMAIACNPEILVADEPTTALDVTIQAQILQLLLSLQRDRGMGLILVTHNMGVVADTARRVLVMYAGQIVEDRTTSALFQTPQHPYTAALLAARPEHGTSGRLATIPGAPPGLQNRPAGCLFGPRCAYATRRAQAVRPDLRDWMEGLVRCHYPLGDPGRDARIVADGLVGGEPTL
jgi:dipeptide transport system ATP-binding protein